jgi:hypothetical protein
LQAVRNGTSIAGYVGKQIGRKRAERVEVVALRHQVTMLERQLGKGTVRFDASDRAFRTALLCRLPRNVLSRVRLLVHPDTVRAGVATSRQSPRGTLPTEAPGSAIDRAFRPRPRAVSSEG